MQQNKLLSWWENLETSLGRFLRLKLPKAILAYLFLFYYRTFKSQRRFTLEGENYEYFYHNYNYTWLGERTVEIPIIWGVVKKYAGKDILEVGNVLSHYFPVSHDVIDKYEKGAGVINRDIVNFKTPRKYDLIVSISTLEHVGWDEKPRQPKKFLLAWENLQKLLAPGGKIIITLPLGYNHEVDKLIATNRLKLTQRFYLKRISKDNVWQETNKDEVKGIKYSSPFVGANGLMIGVLTKG